MAEGTADFKSQEEASKSPLAQKLFEIDGVRGIFFGADFITVSKADSLDWTVLKPSILGAIMEHFLTHQPLFYENNPLYHPQEEDDPIAAQIREILDTRVRPAV